MAITVVSGPQPNYDPRREIMPAVQRLKLAMEGNESFARELAGEPDFIVELTATTDNSDGTALDLTAQGVLFPADSIREIRGRSFCSTDNDHYSYEWVEDVLGGTTPVLMGQRIIHGQADENGTIFEYGSGLLFVATITALTTIDTIFASKGYSMGDISSGLAAFVVPKNRLFLPTGAVLTGPSAISATQASGDLVTWDTTNLDGLGTGTGGVVFLDVSATTDGAAASPALGGVVSLAFDCWPPFTHRLVMATNSVTVKCAGTNTNIGDDVLRHRVEIFVGKLRQLTHHS